MFTLLRNECSFLPKYATGKLGLHKLTTILFGNRSEKRGQRGKEKEEEGKIEEAVVEVGVPDTIKVKIQSSNGNGNS